MRKGKKKTLLGIVDCDLRDISKLLRTIVLLLAILASEFC